LRRVHRDAPRDDFPRARYAGRGFAAASEELGLEFVLALFLELLDLFFGVAALSQFFVCGPSSLRRPLFLL
jgi:hypothetical protein